MVSPPSKHGAKLWVKFFVKDFAFLRERPLSQSSMKVEMVWIWVMEESVSFLSHSVSLEGSVGVILGEGLDFDFF